MLKLTLSSLLFLLFVNGLFAQDYHQADTIPFTLTSHNNIVVKSIINEKDTVDLMFHTASDLLTLTEEATARMTNIQFNAPDSINSWGGKGVARFSDGNSLKIGALKWQNLEIVENKHSGPTTDGKFGLSFFKDKIVELNYNRNILVIHSTLPKMNENYEQLELLGSGSFLFLEGDSKIDTAALSNKFLIHSGYGGTILYDDEFANENQLSDQLEPISEKELRDAYGNVLKTKKAILPSFSIGNQSFSEMPVGFFEGKIGRQRMSVIGGDLLKRFNIILDLKQSHIYLQASEFMESAYSDI